MCVVSVGPDDRNVMLQLWPERTVIGMSTVCPWKVRVNGAQLTAKASAGHNTGIARLKANIH
jgi:hypothetical protein